MNWRLAAGLGGMAMIAAGCGSSSTGPSQPYAPPTRPLIVQHPGGAPDALYDPDPILLRVGQSITWTNKDHEPHDVTSFAGHFSSGPIAYGATFTWTASRAGTFHYFCTLHPDMHGVVIVRRRG